MLVVANDGTLAYSPRSPGANDRVASFDRAGNALRSFDAFSSPRVSLDGQQLAVGRNGNVWTYDLDRAQEQRMTSDSAREVTAVWSHDGTKKKAPQQNRWACSGSGK